jgi:putative ABC transport system permease protein
MALLAQNLRYALRTLRANPGLTCTVLVTIALGIGANTAIFTAAYATLLAPLPYPNPDRLVNVWSKVQGHRSGVSPGDYLDWKRQGAVFEDLSLATEDNFNVATGGTREYLDGGDATPGYLKILGDPLMLGRSFLSEEAEPGRSHVVILTHKLWQRMGSDPRILGQAMHINGERYSVVGVLAPGAMDRFNWELLVPLVFTPQQHADHDSRYWVVTGSLKPGVTIAQAQAEMDAITARLAQQYPASNRGWGALVEPYKNDFWPQNRRSTLQLLLGASAFLLLIGCLNVANLLLAKGIVRQRDVAIRGALGARPRTILGQFFMESLLLAALSAVVGVAAGYAMLRGLIAAMPAGTLPAEADLSFNIPILLAMLAAALLAGLIFGCAPAWYASRVDPADALREGGRAGTGVGGHRLRRALVVGEFALSLALLSGAGLAIHSFWNLTHVDLGVRTDHLLGFYIDSVPLEKAPTQTTTNAYYARVLDTVRSLPGVTAACAVSYLPLDSFYAVFPFSIAGQPAYADPSLRPIADVSMVTPDYFKTFGIGIVQGRGFTDADRDSSLKVAMVNQTFASRFLKSANPIGQRVVLEQVVPGQTKSGPPVEWRIVGVFHDVKSRGSRENIPEIDVPFWQEAFSISGIAVRTAIDPASMLKSVQAAVTRVDPEAAFWRPRTMDQIHGESLANDRFTTILFAGFAAVALLLAAIGIYGVMAFSVQQRAREIALRTALGATRQQALGLLMKEGAMLACTGLVLGLTAAYFVGRAMQSILYGVRALDAGAIAAVSLLLLLCALGASYLPARKAVSMDPMRRLGSQ